MAPRRLDPHNIASALPPGGRTLVAGCSGESLLLADAVKHAGDALGAMTFTGIFVPGLNTRTYLANPEMPSGDLFPDAGAEGGGSAVKFLPLCYADILSRLRSVPIDAALFMTTPPDARRQLQLRSGRRFPCRAMAVHPGPHRAYQSPTAARREPMPNSVQRADGLCRGRAGIARLFQGADDSLSQAIGEHVARFVEDGSTIQMGLGKIPTAVLRALRGRRDLKIHSGLIPEAVVDLEDAGALAPGVSVTGGVAIGSRAALRSRGFRRLSLSSRFLHARAARCRTPQEGCVAQFGAQSRSLRAGLCRTRARWTDVGAGRRVRFRARRLGRRRLAHPRPRCLGRQGRDQPRHRAGRELRPRLTWTHGYGRRGDGARRCRPARS